MTRFLFSVLFLISFVAMSEPDNPFVGTWKLDKVKSMDVDFTTQGVSKVKEQTLYVDKSLNNSLIFFVIHEGNDGKNTVYHYFVYPDGRVTEELSREGNGKVEDRFQTKKIDELTYEAFGVQVDPKKGGKNDWYGTVSLSKDKQFLTFKIEGIPGTEYKYFYKVYRRIS